MSVRVGVFSLLCAFAMMGCQFPNGTDAPDLSASAVGPAPLASNELDRLGRQDIDAGNNGLAEDHFRAATEQNRNDAFAWIGLAAAYDNLKRFELADQAYAQATRISGESLSIINNIGYSYYLRGDRARALSQLQHALTLYPDNPVILNNIRLVRSGERPNSHVAP